MSYSAPAGNALLLKIRTGYAAPSGAAVNLKFGTSPDPLWDNVVLLLHGEGAAGSTTFFDSSAIPRSVSAIGSAQHVTTPAPPYGTSAIRGAVQLATGSIPTWANLTNCDFTLETQIYRTAAGATTIFTARDDGVGTSGLLFYVNAGGQLVVHNGPNEVFSSGSFTVPVGAWTHVEWGCSGSTMYLFITGALRGTGTRVGATVPSGFGVRMGSSNDGGGSTLAYFKDYRITRGAVRHTANFTPPSALLPDAGSSADAITGTLAATLAVTGGLAGTHDAPIAAGTLATTLSLAGGLQGAQVFSGAAAAVLGLSGAMAGVHAVGGPLAATLSMSGAIAALHPRYRLHGIVKKDGVAVERRVRAYRRSTGALVAEGDTAAGVFELAVGYALDEFYIVPIDLANDAEDWRPPVANRVLSVLVTD